MSAKALTCARTGFCCMLIPIPCSPRSLREAHEVAVSGENPNGVKVWQDIETLYPMLLDRCRGKRRVQLHNGVVEWRYVYGPCLNLDWAIEDGKLMSSCSIHDKKPNMCSGFPYSRDDGPHRDAVTMGGQDVGDNPGTFKGCGFNADPRAGWDIETYETDLIPLDKEEK